MIEGSLSYFDAGVVAIVALSCLFAFFRGFVKEILSLGAWVGAGLITLYYFQDVATALEPRFKSTVVASGIATLGIYIVSLLGFSIINSLIMRYVKEGSDVGPLDNALGLMFGAFRGAFLVSLGYLMITMLMSEDDMPKWIKKAHTKPLVQEGAIILARAAPEYLREISTLHGKIEPGSAGKAAPWAKEKTAKAAPGQAAPEAATLPLLPIKESKP